MIMYASWIAGENSRIGMFPKKGEPIRHATNTYLHYTVNVTFHSSPTVVVLFVVVVVVVATAGK